MTLNDWLDVALRDLAPAAWDRMTAEYHAHVQDAMHSGLTEPEAVATLGDPAQVNRALRRTYATDEELSNSQGAWMWMFSLLVVTSYAAVTLWLVRPEAATGPLVALLLAPLIWLLVRREPQPVRNFLLATAGHWIVNFSLWMNWMLQLWRGDAPPSQGLLWFFPVLWLVWMLDAGRRIQRIQRTLKLGDRA
ncbi:HAAS signaling domain-containing protein [Deinococcus sedimenti]|uniref:DUF1700 domain-containing protein n=1 Tax=Deinococcus sedimenti TaxID=1867090 RepID=A0ABQ2S6F6_9DEIO|nr:hypothetical protein [Deinococcus sedimenti]GGS02284.1 hypothetical protein GCM10008960_31190 [Deinococcus sedimenti]